MMTLPAVGPVLPVYSAGQGDDVVQEFEDSSGHCTSTWTVTDDFGNGGAPRLGLWMELTRHLSSGSVLLPPTQLIATV
ncbi:hypothetical protein A5699_01675 [Mycobacterium sp. E802]|nr:hypothetical protein A5699_01675 [Mycobacterium sp. E802]